MAKVKPRHLQSCDMRNIYDEAGLRCSSRGVPPSRKESAIDSPLCRLEFVATYI